MVIGVDLGGTNIRAAIEKGGTIHNLRKEPFKTMASLDESLEQFISFVRPLLNADVKGIGIGVPSVVDLETGTVHNVMNIPAWECVPLKNILEEEFELPVWINNDVNCFILGEHQYGLVRKYKNAVGLACGTGLGSGIIINNQLYPGKNCGAGEVGLLPYREHTVEYYASGNFFPTFYDFSAAEAYQQALLQDHRALAAWEEFGMHFGQAIKNVVLTYDPEAVVLGGSLSKAFQFFSPSLRASFSDFPFPKSIERLKIFVSEDENISILGAAALVHTNQNASSKVEY